MYTARLRATSQSCEASCHFPVMRGFVPQCHDRDARQSDGQKIMCCCYSSHLPPPTSHFPPPTSHLPPPTSHLPHPMLRRAVLERMYNGRNHCELAMPGVGHWWNDRSPSESSGEQRSKHNGLEKLSSALGKTI